MNKKLALMLPVLILLAHCGTPYVKKSLRALNKKPDYLETQHNVMVRVKELSYNETKSLFGGRGSVLRPKKLKPSSIDPIIISVHNTSNTSWICSGHDINLPLLSTDTLYDHMKLSPTGRATLGTAGIIGGTVAGLAVGGLIGMALFPVSLACHAAVGNPLGILVLSGAMGLATLTSSSVGTYNWAHNASTTNAMLKKELTEQVLMNQDEVRIPAQSITTKLMFARYKHIPPQFKIVLENELNPAEKLTYYVDLEQNNNE